LNSSPQAAMQHLLADTDGALARQTLLQVASLPDQVDPTVGRLDPTAPRWNFEVPFVTAQGTAMAQFEISRDGNGSEVEASKRIWRARFSLDVEPAGPIHALISLSGERTSVRMWAERPATAEQLRAGIPQLSQALSRARGHQGGQVQRHQSHPGRQSRCHQGGRGQQGDPPGQSRDKGRHGVHGQGGVGGIGRRGLERSRRPLGRCRARVRTRVRPGAGDLQPAAPTGQ